MVEKGPQKPTFLEPPNTGHTPTDHEMHKKKPTGKKTALGARPHAGRRS